MSTDQSTGRIITFYSYKGGTGRSMAVANTAVLLSWLTTTTKGVLIIDWDLEAPGVEAFLGHDELVGGWKSDSDTAYEGVLDLFEGMQSRLANEALEGTNVLQMQALVTSTNPTQITHRTKFDKVHFMRSGVGGPNYARRVSQLQWRAIHERAPRLFEALGRVLLRSYDFVLIDSRTGHADSSSICTALMPDTIVSVFTPNLQSTTGLIDVLDEAITHRANSDDLRPLRIFPLPSRVEMAEPRLRRQWRSGKGQQGFIGYQTLF